MKVESLKDLQKLIQLCRKTGVDAITVDGIELKLGSAPVKSKHLSKSYKARAEDHVFTPGGIDEATSIEMPDELTEEQLLFYSSQSHEQVVEG